MTETAKTDEKKPAPPRWKSRLRKTAFALAVLLVLAAIAAYAVPYLTAGQPEELLPIAVPPPGVTAYSGFIMDEYSEPIKVLTLNIAHGRKDGTHQLLQSSERLQANLKDIADVLQKERPNIVALQEADAPSFWTGFADQVHTLSNQEKYYHFIHGKHVQGLKLAYGTALLSDSMLTDPRSFTFPTSPPTFSKGFVVGAAGVYRISLSDLVLTSEPVPAPIDIVSVHLDFSRKSVRQEQVAIMVKRLKQRGRPLILMGDLNCEWNDEDDALRILAKELNLKAYTPEAEGLKTFPTTNKRLDWILISQELEFVSYKVLPDTLSDHQAVMAEIRWAKKED